MIEENYYNKTIIKLLSTIVLIYITESWSHDGFIHILHILVPFLWIAIIYNSYLLYKKKINLDNDSINYLKYIKNNNKNRYIILILCYVLTLNVLLLTTVNLPETKKDYLDLQYENKSYFSDIPLKKTITSSIKQNDLIYVNDRVYIDKVPNLELLSTKNYNEIDYLICEDGPFIKITENITSMSAELIPIPYTIRDFTFLEVVIADLRDIKLADERTWGTIREDETIEQIVEIYLTEEQYKTYIGGDE